MTIDTSKNVNDTLDITWRSTLEKLADHIDAPSFAKLPWSMVDNNIESPNDSAPNLELIVPLQEYVIVTVSGPKISQFLQGQCTCNFLTLGENIATYGSHCTPKGRMIASFLAKKLPTNNDEECFGLRVHQSCAKALCDSLSKYGIFSKAKVAISQSILPFVFYNSIEGEPTRTTTSKAYDVWKNCTAAIAFSLPLNAYSDNLSFELKELWLPIDNLEAIEKHTLKTPSLNTSAWNLIQIRTGIYDVRDNTSEALLPQEINHQQLDAIDFKKGCYTGQEIIARLHYKGQLKKQLQSIQIKTESNENEPKLPFDLGLNIGDSCDDPDILKNINSAELNIGQVLLAVKTDHNAIECLSILKNDALKNEHENIIEVNIRELPYY